MGEEQNSVLRAFTNLVDKFVASSEATSARISKEIEKVSSEVDVVKDRMNTPPRHEELAAKLDHLNTEVDGLKRKMSEVSHCINKMIVVVVVAVSLFGIAALITAAVVNYSKVTETRNIERIEQQVEKIDSYLERIEKGE
jgi:hypothetical protein